MGLTLKKDILAKLYEEFSDIEKRDINNIINHGDKRLLSFLHKDIDVYVQGNIKKYDGILFCSIIYGKLRKVKDKIQRDKKNNRNRVNKFLKKQNNE